MLFSHYNQTVIALRRMSNAVNSSIYSAPTKYRYDALFISQPSSFVFHIELNRPEKRNAMNKVLWREIGECFKALGSDDDCRAIVLGAKGSMFTSGIDLADLSSFARIDSADQDIGRKCKVLKEAIANYQQSMSSLEKCSKPVICATHSYCVGGGVDLICAGDIRYCTSDAWFQVKEVDVGLPAGMGTLQRLSKIVGNESFVRELCFTTRKLYADEAFKMGFISKIFPDQPALLKAALEVASLIAEKLPVAVQATKEALIYSRDHSVQEGLDYMGITNKAFLLSEDVTKSVMASMNHEKPVFSKL